MARYLEKEAIDVKAFFAAMPKSVAGNFWRPDAKFLTIARDEKTKNCRKSGRRRAEEEMKKTDVTQTTRKAQKSQT